MKILEIKDGQNIHIDGEFLIRIINGKTYLISTTRSMSVCSDKVYKGFEDDDKVVYLYWDYCDDLIQKHVYYYYSLVDKTILALIDDNNYVSGVERNKPYFMSDPQYETILRWFNEIDKFKGCF